MSSKGKHIVKNVLVDESYRTVNDKYGPVQLYTKWRVYAMCCERNLNRGMCLVLQSIYYVDDSCANESMDHEMGISFG